MISRVLLITNINNHYRDPLFRILRERYGFDFIFYSDGGEPYWSGATFPIGHLGARELGGFWIGRTRITPALIWRLTRSPHEVVICVAAGKFTLPLVWAMTRVRRRHLILWTGVWQPPRFRFHRTVRPLVRRLLQNADAVVAYGLHVSRALRLSGVPPERIFLAPQAIDSFRFSSPVPETDIQEFRDAIGLIPTDIVLLYVGRLEASKGVLTLLHAMKELLAVHKNAALLIVGSGSQESSLLATAHQLNVAHRVRFLGRRGNDELPLLYHAADVVVVPSEPTVEGAEPWGLVVNEAMASGCPVIASDAVGAAAHGLPADGAAGLIFPAGDAAALADALAKLVASADTRSRMAQAAVEQVRALTYERMVDGIVAAVRHASSKPARA